MKDFKEFVKNLTIDDVDLINKLDNMSGCEISDELYIFIRDNEKIFSRVEEFVIKYVIEYEDFIVEETESLYEQEFIEDKYDYSGGLYNCDEIYVRAILNALGILWLPHRL